MEIAETTLTLISYWLMNDFQGQHFLYIMLHIKRDKCVYYSVFQTSLDMKRKLTLRNFSVIREYGISESTVVLSM